MSYDPCYKCGDIAYKTDGEGHHLCYNLAFNGHCLAESAVRSRGLSATGLTMPREITQTTGRNAPCPCGSGKKYKRCCIK